MTTLTTTQTRITRLESTRVALSAKTADLAQAILVVDSQLEIYRLMWRVASKNNEQASKAVAYSQGKALAECREGLVGYLEIAGQELRQVEDLLAEAHLEARAENWVEESEVEQDGEPVTWDFQY